LIFAIQISLANEIIYDISPTKNWEKINNLFKNKYEKVIEINKYLKYLHNNNIIDYYLLDSFNILFNNYDKLILEIKEAKFLAEYYYNKGIIYYKTSYHYETSLLQFIEAEKYYKKNRDNLNLILSLIQLGKVNNKAGLNDLARKYFFDAYQIYLNNPNTNIKLVGLIAYGYLNFLKKNYSEYSYILNEFDNLIKNQKNIEELNLSLSSEILELYYQIDSSFNQILSVEKLIKWNIEYLEKNTNKHFNLNDFYLSYYFLKLKNFKLSEFYIQKVLNDNKLQEYNKYLSNRFFIKLYELASSIYEKLKDFEKAYYYKKLEQQISTIENNKDKRLEAINLDNELRQLRYERNLAIENESKVRITLLLVGLIFIILISTIFILFRLRDKQKLNKELAKLVNAKDKLFSIISHDLRSPTASLKQLLELISSKFDKISDENKINYINLVKENANKLYLLIDNLLNWSKLNLNKINLTLKSTNLKVLIETEIDMFKEVIKNKRIKINLEYKGNEIKEVDEDILRVIFRNLLSNAIKYSNIEGTININILNNDILILEIADSGIGMDEELIKNIYQSKNIISTSGTLNERGNGLGLNIVNELVKIHNGEFIINSLQNKGTTITVKLKYN
jgi:signal transduction histidine kinase